MPQHLDQLFHRHVALAFDKQMRLGDFLREKAGSANWGLDPRTGILNFGDKVRFETQILGSQSDRDDSWLWAWGNEAAGIPDKHLLAGRVLQKHGAEHGVPQFTTALVNCYDLFSEDLASMSGHALAAIAVGLLHYDAYYRTPYEGGAAFVLIKDARLRSKEDLPLARILSIFPQALSGYPISDQKEALRAYLEHYGFAPVERGNDLVVQEAGKEILTASFDDLGRLTNLTGTVGKS